MSSGIHLSPLTLKTKSTWLRSKKSLSDPCQICIKVVQDCSNSSALAMELLQSCAKPFISYLGMKSWDLHVCDRASTITHVDRVKKSNPWYNKIWLCLNVTIWSSQICFSVIFIHFVMIQNIWEKKLHLLIIHTFFNHPSLLQLIFGRL